MERTLTSLGIQRIKNPTKRKEQSFSKFSMLELIPNDMPGGLNVLSMISVLELYNLHTFYINTN